MEPRRLRACEALTEDLAQRAEGNSEATMMLPQASSQQLAMGIPSHLIFLCGLLGVTRPPFSTESRELFANLQKLYHEEYYNNNNSKKEDKNALKLFHLSPSLLPSPCDQEKIQKEVDRKIQQLEAQALEIEQELREEAQKEALKSNKQQAKKKHKPQPARKSLQPSPKSEVKEEVPTRPTETLQQVLAQIQVPQTEDDDTNDESWVAVGKKTKPQRQIENEPKLPEHQKDTSFIFNETSEEWPEDENLAPKRMEQNYVVAQEKSESEDLEKESEMVDTTESMDNETLETNNNVHPELENAAQIKIDISEAGKEPAAVTNNNTVEELQERVRELEQALAKSEQDRAEAEAKLTKELRAEREQSEERLQALQLRLYISETRLKTYEDALEQHVVAVANNVASRSPDRHSLPHGQLRDTLERSSPSRPLSRVLNQSAPQSH